MSNRSAYILDNHSGGKIADWLRDKMSAIDSMRFLFELITWVVLI